MGTFAKVFYKVSEFLNFRLKPDKLFRILGLIVSLWLDEIIQNKSSKLRQKMLINKFYTLLGIYDQAFLQILNN